MDAASIMSRAIEPSPTGAWGIVQSISNAIPGAMRLLLARAPLSPGKVEFAWRAAVGGALDRASVVSLRADRTIVVDVKSSYWRREVQRSRSMVLSRMRELLGSDVVSNLEVRVRDAKPAGRA